jgi:hypothetical protein
MTHGPFVILLILVLVFGSRGWSVVGMGLGMGSVGGTGPHLHHDPHCPALPIC